MIRSTFAGFNMAALAISASQRALDVTGQNLSNIHTTGYTRQRLDQVSLNPVASGISSSSYDAKVGQGVMMTGVSQIRDPFLDIQYRNQLTKVGTADAEDAILSQIGQIFDETDKEAIAYQFQQIISQLQNLADPENTGTNSADTIVRSACEILLNTVHQNGTKIQEVYDELKTKMDETIVPEINEYLRDIAELNESIRNTQILGNPALELQDDRNELIDALATYFPIEVSYEKLNLGGGDSVDILNINLKLSDGSKINLIHDDEYGQVGITKDENGDIVEPIDFFVKESGSNGKTYGGGLDNLKTALPEEMNSYITDIVNLNNNIKKYFDRITEVDAGIGQEQGTINGYLANIASYNNQIYQEKQNANPDNAKIRNLERQRTYALEKLKDYFPKNSLSSEINKDTGMLSLAVTANDGTKLDLISTKEVTGADPISQAGSVSLNVASDNRIMMAVTSTPDGAGAVKTTTLRSGGALYELESQRRDLVKAANKAQTERNEKVNGLNSYLPAGTIDAPVIDPVTGYMSLTANGGTINIIDANNVPGTITLDVQQDTDGNVTATAKIGATTLGDVPAEEIDRMMEVTGEKLADGVIKADLDMLNKAEIFDKYTDPADPTKSKDATDTKGIQYYKNMLDTFIDQFAKTMNELNKTAEQRQVTQLAYDEKGDPIMVADPDDPTKQIQLEVPVSDVVYETEQVQKTDENGKPVTDVNGEPVMETVYKYETQPKLDGSNNPVLDDDGNPVMEPVMEPLQQQVMVDGKPVFNADGTPKMETVLEGGNPVMVPKKIPVMENGAVKMEPRMETVAGSKENPLFATTDGSDRFTASNIKISDDWMNGIVQIQTKRDDLGGGNSSDNWNVERMIDALSSTVFEFKSPDGDTVFKGTLYECYTNIQGTQSIERKATSQILDTHTTVLNQIADNKDSVSGVWMDEEVMSLMKYTQSYNAACRLMTTMDEVLDKLINNTGVVGR